MDIEKAIDCLKADKEYLTDMKICDGEEIDIAIKALEKQKELWNVCQKKQQRKQKISTEEKQNYQKRLEIYLIV